MGFNSDNMLTAPAIQVCTPAEIGRLIRERRKALGLRQADVALRAGVSLPTVGAVEKGKATAQIGVVLGLARDLGLKIGIVTTP